MSKFAKSQAEGLGVKNINYIPHATDVNVYHPLDKIEMKKKWSQILGIDLVDNFVIGAVARFQGRKMMPELFKAFGIYAKKHPDSILLLHSDKNDNANPGVLIDDLENRYNIKGKVFWTGMKFYSGFPEPILNEIYNVMDIHALTTCHHPNTPINTISKFKYIKDIEIGDEVLTKDGTYCKVEDKISYDYNGELIRVKTSYNPDILLTPNHRVYGISCNGSSYNKKKIKKEPILELKPIKEFKNGDFLVIPRIKKIENKEYILFDNESIRLDSDLLWLFGFYAAEGCISQKKEKPGGIIFCCSTLETEYTDKVVKIIKEKFGLSSKIYDDSRHRRTIRIYSSSLGRKFKELFGSGAKNKKIPEWCLFLPLEKQTQLVQGYFDGDGHKEYNITYNTYQFSIDTVSEILAKQFRDILIRLGFFVGYKTAKRQSLVHRLRWCESKYNRIGFMDDDFFYVRIGGLKKEKYTGLIYDLSINRNHNYCNYWLSKNSGEGWGIPTIEAMACEVPSVITDYTTTKEIVTDNNAGIAVPLAAELTGQYNVERAIVDVNKFSDAMSYMYEHPKERIGMGKNGRKAVIRDYSWDVVFPKWVTLLESLGR
jgi:hypothetical protein